MKSNLYVIPVTSALGASVAMAALAEPVVGQSKVTEPSAATIETVVVTANRRDEMLSDVPSSIQAFTGEKLDTAGIRDLTELFNYIPGASQGRSTTAGTRSFQIRGISSYYGDSTVGYYLDEVMFIIPNRNFAPVVSAFDVERVEVQRGPQGTLYGLGAMGGTVRFITADPDLKQVQARANLGYSWTRGGDPNYIGDAAVSVPLSENVAGIRASASFGKQGGYASSPTFSDQLNTNGLRNFRLKFLAKPDRDWTIKLGYQYTHDSDPLGQQFYTVNPNRFPPSVLRGQPAEFYNTARYNMGTAFVAYDAGFASIESASGYIERVPRGQVPLDVGLPFFPILNTGGPSRTLSSELRAVSKGNGPMRWTAGTIYLDAQNIEDVVLFGPAPRPLRNGHSVYDSGSYAVFGELSTDLLDGRLTPLFGLRYFNDRRTFRDVDYNAVPGSQNYDAAATFTSWNPRFNLAYKLTPNTMTYLNIAKGFRSGTFNSQSALTFSTVPVSPTVAPDKVLSYEVGSKSTLANRKVSLNLAAYYLDWTDDQLVFQTPAPARASVVVNAGTVRGYGIDYGVDWITPIKGLALQVTGNFNRTYFANLNIPNASVIFANTNIVVGRQLAPVPKQSFTLAGTYYTPLPAYNVTLSVYGSYAFIGKQGDFGSLNPSPPNAPPPVAPLGSAQNLLKLRLGVEGDRWRAFLVGENLLNGDKAFIISGSGIQRNYPRTLGLELRLNY